MAHNNMKIKKNSNLAPYHTFAINQVCRYLVFIEKPDDLCQIMQDDKLSNLPKLMLGKGSNVLFSKPFQGVVLINKMLGKHINSTDDAWLLHLNAGEDWPTLVKWSLEQGMYGLENLAMIPGCVGSAPIQNIGAYGVEFKDFCQYVDVFWLDSLTTQRLSPEECQFGYRDSVFKQSAFKQAVITGVGIKLAKNWRANINYAPLISLGTTATAQEIFTRVCEIRSQKLPDPSVLGNAGSFFKNPLVTGEQFKRLKQRYPEIVSYPAADKVKLAAAWLIDKCQLKGRTLGGAKVHEQQALVLVNNANACAEDITQLAELVINQVFDKFGVPLEPEVRFIGDKGEISPFEIIKLNS